MIIKYLIYKRVIKYLKDRAEKKEKEKNKIKSL